MSDMKAVSTKVAAALEGFERAHGKQMLNIVRLLTQGKMLQERVDEKDPLLLFMVSDYVLTAVTFCAHGLTTEQVNTCVSFASKLAAEVLEDIAGAGCDGKCNTCDKREEHGKGALH